MANSRIIKKKRKRSIIVYDANSLPVNMTFQEVLSIVKRKGVLLYQTDNGGNKPVIYPKHNTQYFKFRLMAYSISPDFVDLFI